ncbi:MAG: cation transporter [Chloroflexota bacterium]|nr:cation transporter [Chloroflexota bacterium]
MANEKVEFKVVGEQTIHCAGCEQRIGNVLKRVPGVQDVQASHRTQEVRATIDSAQTDGGQVRAKLEQLGYEVTPQGGA